MESLLGPTDDLTKVIFSMIRNMVKAFSFGPMVESTMGTGKTENSRVWAFITIHRGKLNTVFGIKARGRSGLNWRNTNKSLLSISIVI